jgi:4-hydroxy-tetrahydrodipicolinate synthase
MTRLIDTTTKGVFPISVTPFLDDGAIDFVSLDRLADWFVDIGVPGLTVLGFMGEANRLSEQEALDVVRHVLKRVRGKAATIVGVNHTGIDGFCSFANAVMDAGASGIMVSPAPGLRTEEQVLGYFDTLLGRLGSGVPVVLQDYPQNSGVYLSAETLDRLFKRHAAIKVLKHEEGSALRKITRVRAQEEDGSRSRIAILVGNSGIHLPQELRRGVDGANTGVAFPEMLIEVCKRFFSGHAERAEDLYDILLPLIRHEQQPGVGLAIRKEIFRRRGLIKTGRARAPAATLDAVDHEELSRLLTRLDRRLKDSGEGRLITTYAVGK